MRLTRLIVIFIAFYFVFLGGSAYYTLIFPIRVLHHIIVTALLALWLLNRIRHGKGIPETPLNWPIYGAFAVWVVSAAASIDPRMAFENLWFPITHVILFFALVDLLQRGQQRLVMETQFMLAALVVFVSGLELASWYFGLGITPGTEIGWIQVLGPDVPLPLQPIRLSLAMNISTLLAGYVAPLITLSIGWALTARRRDYRITLRILAGLLLIVLVLTVSRGGILSVASAVGALAVMRAAQSDRLRAHISARLFISLAAAAALVGIIVFTVYTLSQSRRSGDEGRVDMWASAVEMSLDHPILGVGPGLYGRAFRDYRDPTLARDKLASAHNAYLNTAAETGIAGIIVSLWLAVTFVRTWWRTWQQAASSARKLRLEAAFAALIGVAVHSMVDVFTTTPLVLTILLLAAYSITGHRSRLDSAATGRRLPALIALVVILGYGVWFLQLDRAQGHYQRSLFGGEHALDEARSAHEIDPALRLYSLQIAYLTGQKVGSDPGADLNAAVEAYELALELEPTWAVGWINLAALVHDQGKVQQAIDYLYTAWQIDYLNTAPLHWARRAEQAKTAPEQDIITAYTLSIGHFGLPLADFWYETDLRRQAVETYASRVPLDWSYRIFAAHDPARAYALVPTEPASAADWWVVGEYSLTVEHNEETASAAFSNAIRLDSTNGDYYVARARANIDGGPDSAQRDLNIAQLLGTRFEYPNAVRALLATSPEDQQDLRANALPPRVVGQAFAAVLYGCGAAFDVFPEMREPGPGEAALQPWYAIAEQQINQGHIDEAIQTYHAILDYAPYASEARRKLDELQSP